MSRFFDGEVPADAAGWRMGGRADERGPSTIPLAGGGSRIYP